jgi:hypothetical protein
MNIQVGQLWRDNIIQDFILEVVDVCDDSSKCYVRSISAGEVYCLYHRVVVENYFFLSGPRP